MPQRVSVAEYLDGPESLARRELIFGLVREPPAPRFGHQTVLTRLAALLDAHVRERALGRVCVAPVDVVLDREAALVVQPDLVFIAADRLALADDRIWGAPDLVVEVLSPGTARRDRTTKLAWYERYGVRECWLVDPQEWSVSVVDLAPGRARRRIYAGNRRMRSRVLPAWDLPAARMFA